MPKFSQLPEDTSPATTDFLSGYYAASPSTQKFKLSNLITLFFNNGTPRANLMYNPYKFSVYCGTAQNVGTGDTVLNFDTKNFDTSSNVDVVTNKGRFTAPVTGFWQFNASTFTTGAGSGTNLFLQLFKNGSTKVAIGASIISSVGNTPGSSVSALLQLTAGDYIEVKVGSQGAAKAIDTSSPSYNTFSGFLVSAT